MPSLSVFGAQWGDEGKGKIIDRLSAAADYVVRYQGGANAGHTVIVGGQKYVLHLVPSGILHPGRINVIGNGLAVDPIALLEEIDGLGERGVAVSGQNLFISPSAQVILEHHRLVDALNERSRGATRIGTTGRGIGPCYSDKARRIGLRIGDLLDPDRCRSRLAAALAEKNAVIEKVHGEVPLELDAQLDKYMSLGDRLRPFVRDTGAELRHAYDAGKQILFEGAQGLMLDIDHGTYPYVTSSNTGTNGIPSGAGFPARKIDRSIGIAKAYCTRVGEGPFPSEEHGPDGEAIREAGKEYGATTGRPRRCGWFDTVAARYALEINGADGLVMTNLDVLTGFEEIRAVTRYTLGSQELEEFPAGIPLEEVEAHFETHPGWSEEVTAVRDFDLLPESARGYVEWIESLVGVPIVMISVGADRDQVISRGL